MIHTAKQLKDKVKNMSGGNSEVDDLTWGEVSETIVEEIPIVLEDFLLKDFNIQEFFFPFK